MNMYAMMLEKAFNDADKNKSGEIDKNELKDVLNNAVKIWKSKNSQMKKLTNI